MTWFPIRHWTSTGTVFTILVLLASPSTWGQAPLDILDGTARNVLIRVEDSTDLSVVGQSFGTAFPAAYSASGNIGTLEISAATHEQMRAGFLLPVSGSFTPIIIEFDLTTLEATSQSASGQLESGPLSLSFTQNSLSTAGVGGFMGPDISPLFCTSQEQVDDACMIVPIFCGQVCTIVSGGPYDPLTGLVNLVGSETQTGCDGAVCNGPFDFFTGRGDLLLTEALPMGAPAIHVYGMLTLISLIAVTAAHGLVRARRARR